jgi:hypothetical protein
MPTTPRGLPYPSIDDAPAGPYAFEQLAITTDANLENISNRVEFLESVNPLGHMGRTAGFQGINAEARIVMDSAQVLRGGMAFDNATDSLVVPLTGYYLVNVHLYASGTNAVEYRGRVAKNGGASFIGPKVSFWKETGGDYYQGASSLVLLEAGDKLSLHASASSSNSSVYGSTGYDGCFIEAEYRGPEA